MKTVLLSVTLLLGISLQAQTRAVTDKGKEVILYDNGKWEYVSDSSNNEAPDTIALNTKVFSKPSDASFLVKSKRFNVGVAINPSKWTFKAVESASSAQEYMFQMKSTEGYAMLITEKISLPLEALREAAIVNAQNAAPDAKESFSEYRMVNGMKVLYMEIKGTLRGIKFNYAGYYYSNSNGTVQFVGFTTQNLFTSLKPALTEILNGLTEIKQ